MMDHNNHTKQTILMISLLLSFHMFTFTAHFIYIVTDLKCTQISYVVYVIYICFYFEFKFTVMNFRHGPLQPHPGVTRIRVRAGTENLSVIGSARTYHLLELPGGGRNVNVFIN